MLIYFHFFLKVLQQLILLASIFSSTLLACTYIKHDHKGAVFYNYFTTQRLSWTSWH